MNFEPTTCSDCQYPPNFIISQSPKSGKKFFYTIKCRDCGDIWEESPDLETVDIEDDNE